MTCKTKETWDVFKVGKLLYKALSCIDLRFRRRLAVDVGTDGTPPPLRLLRTHLYLYSALTCSLPLFCHQAIFPGLFHIDLQVPSSADI